jgi:hypothetical protein
MTKVNNDGNGWQLVCTTDRVRMSYSINMASFNFQDILRQTRSNSRLSEHKQNDGEENWVEYKGG